MSFKFGSLKSKSSKSMTMKFEDSISIADLENELAAVDSAISPDFTEEVMQQLNEDCDARANLSRAFYKSFGTSLTVLMSLLIVFGPALRNKMAYSLYGPPPGSSVVSDSFQTVSIAMDPKDAWINSSKERKVEVLIELVGKNGASNEFVSGVLRVSKRSPNQAVLYLPENEAQSLSEIDRRIAL